MLYISTYILMQEKKTEIGAQLTREKSHIIAVTELSPKARWFPTAMLPDVSYVMFYVNVGVKGRRGVVVFGHISFEKSV